MDEDEKNLARMQLIRRTGDATQEHNEFLAAITGYENKPIVSIEEAVKPLIPIVYMIEIQTMVARNICRELSNDLTKDEAAAIMLYTMSWEPYEQCLFPILNGILQSKSRTKLKPWFLYLKLLFVALDRLPAIANQSLFRGVKRDLSDEYKLGQPVIWWGFSSCTISEDITEREEFCGGTGKRTMFIIDCNSGKNIRNYSYYPDEDEVVILPATQFEVVDRREEEPGFLKIYLKETNTLFQLRAPLPNCVSYSKKTSDNMPLFLVYCRPLFLPRGLPTIHLPWD